MRKRFAAAALAALAALAAISVRAGGADEATTAREALPSGIAGSEWTLLTLVAAGAEWTLVGEAVPTFMVEESGKVAGVATVNRYVGRLEVVAAGQFRWQGPLATTRMAGPEVPMEQESRFLGALGRATEWHLAGARLVLTSPGGGDRLEFQR